MPYTAVLFSYRKPGLSPEAYKLHYETVHIPMLQEIAGPLFPQSWTRHYIQRSAGEDGTRSATVTHGNQADFSYDSYAELIFEDKIAFETFFARLHEKDAFEKLKGQEEKFADRAKFRMAIVDETNVTRRRRGDEEYHGCCDDMSVCSMWARKGAAWGLRVAAFFSRRKDLVAF